MKKEEIQGKFDPKKFEDTLYERWEKNGCFKPSKDRTKTPYTIVIPPPNITGRLHMGHALDDTIQDILIRYKRMAGFNALWIPGTDHAAIATEVKVVNKLKEKGITKEELGREKFLEEAWNWKNEYGNVITNQIRKIGCSCDWDHERFTLDEGLSNAVKEVFVRLYEKGLIYRGKRMINWCPDCNTSISDAEVEYEEESTHLWHIKYKIKGSEDYIIVATTRPETMLGDTGVAVNPSDDRYKHLIGKKVILPIMNKEIPIIGDEFVEKDFGTGCVKLTPCHDYNDYESAKRHNLEFVQVFDEHFKMGNLVPEYEGMDLLVAREKIVEKLKELGALVKVEDYTHNVGKCYRCHNTIEPKISEQWFVKMEPLAKPAIDVVKNGELRIIPDKYEKTYFNWLENIQDWCISRQLWWGHRIPAYYCDDCKEIIVSRKKPEKCSKCGSTNLHQDEDTLDTWFSSALWPFSTLGWPEETEDFKYFFPTSTLVTAYDIIFFWVVRMVFSSLEHTGKIPFKDVFIHGIVRDSQGRKMSKSLGNGIDPLDIIEKYGTDALRFSLIIGITPGNDIRYMPEKLDSASNFANKLWNASKFVLMANEGIENIDDVNLKVEDKWILNKLSKTILEVTYNIDKYELGVALQKIYNFLWDEFCDWYIEMVKPRLYSENMEDKKTVVYTLNKVLECSLKLLHPFMPFITTKIYDAINGNELMISDWPKAEVNYEKEENFIEKIKEIIVGIRNIRIKMNVHPTKKSDLIFVLTQRSEEEFLKQSYSFIQKLGFAQKIEIKYEDKNIPQNAINIMTDGINVFIPFEELVNIEEERKRLNEEKNKLEAEVARSETILSNQGFIEKAPKTKIDEEKEKLVKYKDMLDNVKERLNSL